MLVKTPMREMCGVLLPGRYRTKSRRLVPGSPRSVMLVYRLVAGNTRGSFPNPSRNPQMIAAHDFCDIDPRVAKPRQCLSDFRHLLRHRKGRDRVVTAANREAVLHRREHFLELDLIEYIVEPDANMIDWRRKVLSAAPRAESR